MIACFAPALFGFGKMGNTATPCAAPGGEVENSESHVRVHDYLFPMYVVKVSDFLLMEGAPEPHHILKEKGLLHEWQPGMFATGTKFVRRVGSLKCKPLCQTSRYVYYVCTKNRRPD